MNRPPTSEHLNVFLIGAAAYSDPVAAPLLSELGTWRNAVAIPPNVILVDAALLEDLVGYMMGEVSARANLDSIMRTLEDHPDRDAELNIRIARMTFGGTIVSQDAQSQYRRLLELQPEHSAEFRDWNRRTLVALGNPLEPRAFADGFASLFLPMFLHELGHLPSSFAHESTVAPLTYLNSLVKDRFGTRPDEEAMADGYMLRGVERYLSKLPDERSNGSILGLLAYAKYLRNRAVTTGFEGFRGLEPTELFITLLHKPCPDDSELSAWPGFAHADAVDGGFVNSPPLMTKAEFRAVSTRVKSTFGGAHSHPFLRINQFVRVLSSWFHNHLHPVEAQAYDLSLAIDDYSRFADAIRLNEPSLLRRDRGTAATGLPSDAANLKISLDELLGNTIHDFTFENAVTCEESECIVGFFVAKRRGYIEAIGPRDNLKEFRAVFQTFGEAGDTSKQSYVDSMALMVQLVFNALRADASREVARESPTLESIIRYRRGAQRCGGAFQTFVTPDYFVQLYTASDHGLSSLVLTPLPDEFNMSRPGYVFDSNQGQWIRVTQKVR